MGYRLKPKHFRSRSRIITVLSDVSVSRSLYKTESHNKIYTKIYIFKILYKNVGLNRSY